MHHDSLVKMPSHSTLSYGLGELIRAVIYSTTHDWYDPYDLSAVFLRACEDSASVPS